MHYGTAGVLDSKLRVDLDVAGNVGIAHEKSIVLPSPVNSADIASWLQPSQLNNVSPPVSGAALLPNDS